MDTLVITHKPLTTKEKESEKKKAAIIFLLSGGSSSSMGDITAKWTRWDQNKNIRVIVDASERRVCESEWPLVLSMKEILLPHKSNTGSPGGRWVSLTDFINCLVSLCLTSLRVQQRTTSSPTMVSILGYHPENGIDSINITACHSPHIYITNCPQK